MTVETHVFIEGFAPVGVRICTDGIENWIHMRIDRVKIGVPARIREIEEFDQAIRLLLGQSIGAARGEIRVLVTQGVAFGVRGLVRR